MYNWPESQIQSLSAGLRQASEKIKQRKPDLIIAPMMGAVPLMDLINAVDCGFDNSDVFYVPASGTLPRVEEIIIETTRNILREKAVPNRLDEGLFKIITIDEVVGGGSSVRTHTNVRRACKRLAREYMKADKPDYSPAQLDMATRELLRNRFDVRTLGIAHGLYSKTGKPRGSTYLDLVQKDAIIPVEVENLITYDNQDFCPTRYVPVERANGKYYPTIQPDFLITSDYLDLLKLVATAAGNSGDISPKNLDRIREHQKYIPEQFCPRKA